jgi:hypothetical protein
VITWAGDDGYGERARYTLQSEQLRGEARYYAIWVRDPNTNAIRHSLVNHRALTCTKARAIRIAEAYDRGVDPDTAGYEIATSIVMGFRQ